MKEMFSTETCLPKRFDGDQSAAVAVEDVVGHAKQDMLRLGERRAFGLVEGRAIPYKAQGGMLEGSLVWSGIWGRWVMAFISKPVELAGWVVKELYVF